MICDGEYSLHKNEKEVVVISTLTGKIYTTDELEYGCYYGKIVKKKE